MEIDNMGIDNILEEIENLVASSNRVPFLDKVMIDDVELFRLMDVLRSELPREIQDAQDIVARKDDIISAAQAEADRLVEGAKTEANQTVERAKAYAQKAVEESEIVRQAHEEERVIKEQTMAWAQQMKAETEQYSSDLRTSADDYANQVFNHVLESVGDALNAVQQAKNQLNDQNQ